MSTARRVAFVRHGETEWNRQRRIQGLTDVPLNDAGREQARALGRELAAGSWNVLVSSPLTRAVETADLMNAEIGTPVRGRDDALIERGYGRAEGLAVDEVNELWPDGAFPGSESLIHLADRGRSAVLDLLDRYDGNLILVSHGALLRSTLSVLSGRPFSRIENGTATLLVYEADEWTRVPAESVVLGAHG